jgi:hypothetical protein
MQSKHPVITVQKKVIVSHRLCSFNEPQKSRDAQVPKTPFSIEEWQQHAHHSDHLVNFHFTLDIQHFIISEITDIPHHASSHQCQILQKRRRHRLQRIDSVVAVAAGHYWVDAVAAVDVVVGKMSFLHGDWQYSAMTLTMMVSHSLMMTMLGCCCFCLLLLFLHGCFSALPHPHHEIVLDCPWQRWPYGQSQTRKGYDESKVNEVTSFSVSFLLSLVSLLSNGMPLWGTRTVDFPGTKTFISISTFSNRQRYRIVR